MGGDEAEWRSRRGQKDVSLRKLVQHAACPFRKSTLSSAVNVLLFVRQHPHAPELPGITPTHVVQVLGLTAAEANHLLALASQSSWSARDLGREVRVFRRAQGERRGRPAATESSRAETMGRRASKDLQAMQAILSECSFVDDESAGETPSIARRDIRAHRAAQFDVGARASCHERTFANRKSSRFECHELEPRGALERSSTPDRLAQSISKQPVRLRKHRSVPLAARRTDAGRRRAVPASWHTMCDSAYSLAA